MYVRWFQPANLLMGFLLILTLISVFIVRNETEYAVDTTINRGRIVAIENGQFGEFRVYLWTDAGVVRAGVFELLPLGKKVLFDGAFQPITFSDSSSGFDQYERTLGIAGVVDNLWIDAVQAECDAICQIIQTVTNTRRAIEQTYQKMSCQSYRFISDILAPELACADVGALSIGLVTGGTRAFSPEMKESFRTLGLSHLVAVSGFQVVLVMSVIETMCIRLKIRRDIRFGIAIFAVLGMIALVGPQPPVLRSSISIALSQLVLIGLGRRVSGLRLLLYSGLIMLWIYPLYLFSASFQLSFLASVGMILSSGQDIHPLPFRFDRFIKDVVATSVWTFATTLPVIVGLFGSVSALSVVTNVVLIPIIPWITFANLAVLVPGLGEVVGGAVVLVETIILETIRAVSDTAFFQLFMIRIQTFSWWEIVFYYIALISIPQLIRWVTGRMKPRATR